MDVFKNAIRTNKRFYNTNKWKRLRREILMQQPCCIRCGSSDHLHVDHIKPPCGNEELFFDKENLQVLCEICHRQKTAAEIAMRSCKMRDTEAVREWIKGYVKIQDSGREY